jgi:CubicO group peptidase (beta-lactamase class C family)
MWSVAAPTWKDSTYRHQVMQGTVSDGNAYALGGISGHAGLFSTLPDVIRIARLYLTAAPDGTFLNASTVATFRAVHNITQSSRALGWDTNNYQAQPASDRSCGSLSSETYLHLGFTGTQVCIDPIRGMFTILLTNRVYPDEGNIQIRDFRIKFNTLVQQLWDGEQ